MATADPYVQPIPQSILRSGDDEMRAWFEYDNRWKHDIWQKLGGGGDSVEDSADVAAANEIQISQIQGLIAFLQQRIQDLENDVPLPTPVKQYSFVSISSSYTTAGNEYIRVTAAATITLNSTPGHMEEVFVQPTSNVVVTISGSINGDTELVMNHAYDLAHLVYHADIGEWIIS